MEKKEKPNGELVIQTLAMPADTNANGDIFGGWLVSQMDLGAGIVAKRLACGRVTTVAIDSMVFRRPVHVGDAVCCYADMLKVGSSSMKIKIEVWIYTRDEGRHIPVADGIFTYVAIDADGRPRPVDNHS